MQDDKYSLVYIEFFYDASLLKALSKNFKKITIVKYDEMDEAFYYPGSKKHDAGLIFIPYEHIDKKNDHLKKIASIIPYVPLIVITDTYPKEESFKELLKSGAVNLFLTDEAISPFFRQNVYKEIFKKSYSYSRLPSADISLPYNIWQEVIENNPSSILLTDKNGNIIYANKKLKEISGYSPNEIIGKNPRIFKDSSVPQSVYSEMWQTILSGNVWSGILKNRKKSGKTYWESTLISPIKDHTGKITHFVAVKNDISRQKKLEAELSEEHRHLQTIIDSLPAYIYWFGKELKYEGANSNFTQLVAKKENDIIGKEIGSIIKSPRLFELEHSIFHSNINSISENVEVQINDKKIWLMLNLEKYSKDESVLVVAMDITKEKEIEAALKKKNAEFQNLTDSLERKVNERTFELIDLTQSLESKVKQAVEELHEKDALLSMQTRFAAIGETINNIAHQWRQPLNTLGLMVQNLYIDQISGSLDESKMEHSTKKMMEVIKSMSQTIDDFRSFFKIESNKKEFDIINILQKSLSLIEPRIEHQNVSVKFENEQSCIVCGYDNELSQVILIIINNAIDEFIEKDRTDAKIIIRLSSTNDSVHLSIEDNAGGIPGAIVHKIFDPYFTTKEEGKGTGIGLYIAKMIIEKNFFGKIRAESVENGTKFNIIIPLSDKKEEGGQFCLIN